eukprot:m.304284 g.304284  ORF g.304284 m.304284 type:complete len:79 (+) comp40846_c0_seq4:521-757(+)
MSILVQKTKPIWQLKVRYFPRQKKSQCLYITTVQSLVPSRSLLAARAVYVAHLIGTVRGSAEGHSGGGQRSVTNTMLC